MASPFIASASLANVIVRSAYRSLQIRSGLGHEGHICWGPYVHVNPLFILPCQMRGGLATQARKMGMAERKIDRVSEELKSAKQELKNMMELMAGIDSKCI